MPHTRRRAPRPRRRPRPRPRPRRRRRAARRPSSTTGSGKFHDVDAQGPGDPAGPISGLLVTDLDQDGRADLVAPSAAGRVAGRGGTPRRGRPRRRRRSTLRAVPDRRVERCAIGHRRRPRPRRPARPGRPVAAPATHGDRRSPAWARNEGQRLGARASSRSAQDEPRRLAGLALADLVGDPLPDLLLVRDGAAARLARNLGNGHHWLALELGGRWKIKPEHMRTNSHGLGTRVHRRRAGAPRPLRPHHARRPAWRSRSARSCSAWAERRSADLRPRCAGPTA